MNDKPDSIQIVEKEYDQLTASIIKQVLALNSLTGGGQSSKDKLATLRFDQARVDVIRHQIVNLVKQQTLHVKAYNGILPDENVGLVDKPAAIQSQSLRENQIIEVDFNTLKMERPVLQQSGDMVTSINWRMPRSRRISIENPAIYPAVACRNTDCE